MERCGTVIRSQSMNGFRVSSQDRSNQLDAVWRLASSENFVVSKGTKTRAQLPNRLSNPMFRHCVYQLRQQLSSRQVIESQNAPNPQASQMPLNPQPVNETV
mmetsp:Transcript_14747/g.33879  ORF Transcript_14747/g.33879 Transcript_14747/m.33879 type:complete len:102 (-) Transcript_14747:86-391(-)